MARYVFFSFAYADVANFKVNVVRNNWRLKNTDESFVDGSIWEKSKSQGESVLKNLIDIGLNKTSVTVVLIGQEAANRRWINYEIVKSFERGNGLMGIYINRIRGKSGLTARGLNPLDRLAFKISDDGKKVKFFELSDYKWKPFKDLSEINNKRSNTIFFENSFWNGNSFGKFFKFSDFFLTKCWDYDNGNERFSSWIEKAALQAGR